MAENHQKQEPTMADQIIALAYGMNKILARLEQLETGQVTLAHG